MEEELRQTIEQAARELVFEQKEHLARGRVERTFTTDLARKLGPLVGSDVVTVDAFYNKHGIQQKYLDGRLIELDIAVHHRGDDAYNLVAIELETNNNPKCDDVWKLEAITRPLGGYGYLLGLFLVVGVNDKAGQIIALDWYRAGARIRE